MKTKFIYFFLLITAGIILYSCSSSKGGIEPQTGDYTFTIYDNSSNKIMDGMLTIDYAASGVVSGTYKTTTVYVTTSSVVTMLQGGSFIGTYTGSTGQISFNMNPKVADNNVYVGAKVTGSSIDGTWSHTTMTGEKSAGRFNAVQ